jgi:hypothetical protein
MDDNQQHQGEVLFSMKDLPEKENKIVLDQY